MLDAIAEIILAAVLCILTGNFLFRRPTKADLYPSWCFFVVALALFSGASLAAVAGRLLQEEELFIDNLLPWLHSGGYLAGLVLALVGAGKFASIWRGREKRLERLEKAEAEVERHNHFLQDLMDAIPAQVFFKNIKGEYIGSNKMYQENMQRSSEELLGKTAYDLVPKEQADFFTQTDQETFEKGRILEQETTITRGDGEVMNILMHKARFRDAQGNIAGLIGVSLDITARKRMENALRVSEERFRRMSELSNEAIFLHSQGRMIDCNHAALRMFGYSYEEMLVLGVEDLIAPEDIVMVQERITRGESDSYEASALRRDGTRFEINVSAKNSILDGKNSRITFINDISLRKRAESTLRKLSTAVEQNPVAIEITDPTGRIEYVNPTFCAVSGYSAEEIIGQKPSILKSGHTKDEEYKNLWETITSGRVWHGVFQNRRKNGELFWERASISSVVDETGRITNFVATKEDISQQRIAEAQLMEAKERAELASRAKSEFLANMSHELRTPLNAIIGFSELIEREVFGPVGSKKYLEYIADIRNSGDHLLNLINDILDLSKIEAGEFVLNEEVVDLKEMIHSSLIIIRPRLLSSGLSLDLELEEGVRPVLADARGIKQILINLLSNAVKFTRGGGRITVRLKVLEQGVRIEVADSGIGIPADKLSEVTKPFWQVDSSMTRQSQGTGLGLSITHKLCLLHDGLLELISEEGRGTTVSVTLPLSRIVPERSQKDLFISGHH
ncbi:PAS domain-containing sensor histidine kinase [Kiloniella laminariae]|uniref:PAS domain-containing sensor histidine kinase n=1 Tax=Kiloniella laminariae TaxID=454162 RepID=UPI0003A64431|nr:PAS domain-containing sensor histidine kinase [Kiloniella laminariae]